MTVVTSISADISDGPSLLVLKVYRLIRIITRTLTLHYKLELKIMHENEIFLRCDSAQNYLGTHSTLSKNLMNIKKTWEIPSQHYSRYPRGS